MQFKRKAYTMSYKIFVINTGSTSTKIALYEDEKEIQLAKHAIAKAITRMNVSSGGIRTRR